MDEELKTVEDFWRDLVDGCTYYDVRTSRKLEDGAARTLVRIGLDPLRSNTVAHAKAAMRAADVAIDCRGRFEGMGDPFDQPVEYNQEEEGLPDWAAGALLGLIVGLFLAAFIVGGASG